MERKKQKGKRTVEEIRAKRKAVKRSDWGLGKGNEERQRNTKDKE